MPPPFPRPHIPFPPVFDRTTDQNITPSSSLMANHESRREMCGSRRAMGGSRREMGGSRREMGGSRLFRREYSPSTDNPARFQNTSGPRPVIDPRQFPASDIKFKPNVDRTTDHTFKPSKSGGSSSRRVRSRRNKYPPPTGNPAHFQVTSRSASFNDPLQFTANYITFQPVVDRITDNPLIPPSRRPKRVLPVANQACFASSSGFNPITSGPPPSINLPPAVKPSQKRKLDREKDDEYRRKREKNNESAKRSRELRNEKLVQASKENGCLRQQRHRLKIEIKRLKVENAQLLLKKKCSPTDPTSVLHHRTAASTVTQHM